MHTIKGLLICINVVNLGLTCICRISTLLSDRVVVSTYRSSELLKQDKMLANLFNVPKHAFTSWIRLMILCIRLKVTLLTEVWKIHALLKHIQFRHNSTL